MRLTHLFLAMALGTATLLGQAPKPRIRLVTTYGPILIELEPEAAPATAETKQNLISSS